MLNQIREFNTTMILISYGGRIHIQDHHFVQMVQEFTKIANYKLMLFPNLTTAFVQQQMSQTEDRESGQICEYDNYVVDARINMPLARGEMEGEGQVQDYWIELFNKMARFLKVSSGTYNLNRSFEEQPLVSKYKNQYILRYVDELMMVLGK